ncbi:MAG: energy transducer TonB [Chitinophagaceae bacterium]
MVSVQFIVDKDGNISDIKALTNNGYGMEAEVLRAIKKRAVWLPSAQGVPVRPYRTSSATPSRSN